MKSLLTVMVLASLVGCASKSENNKIIKEANATHVTDGKALGKTIENEIESSKTLTADQKKQLTDIIAANKAEAVKLNEKSYQFRAVLIKELLAPKINPKKIRLIKKDIRHVEKLRLMNTFSTVEKISAIVSKHPDHQNFVDHLIIIDRMNR